MLAPFPSPNPLCAQYKHVSKSTLVFKLFESLSEYKARARSARKDDSNVRHRAARATRVWKVDTTGPSTGSDATRVCNRTTTTVLNGVDYQTVRYLRELRGVRVQLSGARMHEKHATVADHRSSLPTDIPSTLWPNLRRQSFVDGAVRGAQKQCRRVVFADSGDSVPFSELMHSDPRLFFESLIDVMKSV